MPRPWVRIAQVSPGFASLVRSSVPVGEIACRKPCGCSSASVLAVKPASARRAAMMPACAALPAWNGLVIVPKFAISPELCDAPSAIACAALSASSRRSDAQAAAAPTAPYRPVGCQPFWCSRPLSRRNSSAQVS